MVPSDGTARAFVEMGGWGGTCLYILQRINKYNHIEPTWGVAITLKSPLLLCLVCMDQC